MKSHRVQLSKVRMHYLDAGLKTAPPLLLLHGWPQTCREWRLVIPRLSEVFRVIAPDLRGLGDTSRPRTGYDSRSVGGDIIELLDHLKLKDVGVVGHAFGALIANSLAGYWRGRVNKLAILDIVLPGFSVEKLVQLGPDGWGVWHFSFHAASDIAERLIQGREREYLSWFFRNMAYDPDAISAAQESEYVRAYTQAGAMRAGLSYYAAFYETAMQNREAAREKLQIPVLAVGGSASLGAMVGEEMRLVAENVTAEVVEECGHWIPEEKPQWLADRLVRFFGS